MCVPYHYSTDIFSAAPVAQGAKTSETINVAPIKSNQACGLVPATLAWTAPLPKMSTGMYRGKTSNATKTFAARNPKVSAAPIDPITLKTGVPSKRETTMIAMLFCDKPN